MHKGENHESCESGTRSIKMVSLVVKVYADVCAYEMSRQRIRSNKMELGGCDRIQNNPL